MRLAVLGPPALVRDDGSNAGLAPGKTFAVLVYLAHAASPPTRADLARLFWPEAPRSNARQSLRQTLSLIRKTLGEEAFASDDPVQLRPGIVESDVHELLRALREGEVERVEDLWRGPFGEGLVLADAPEWTRWLEERQLALERQVCDGLTAAAEAARFRTDAGAEETAEEAIALLRRAIAVDPYRERPRLVLADLLVKQGRLGEAVHAVAEARRALGEDTRDLRALEERIEAERRRRYAEGEAGPAPALEEIFVGRTAEMGRLIGAWARATEGVVATAIVEGPAGIGKTRITTELCEHVRARGGVVAFTSPHPPEAELRGGILRDLEDQVLAGTRDARAATRVRRTEAASGSPPSRDPRGETTGEPSGDEVAAAEAFERLLRRAGAPVLLVVDDLQWADPWSRCVLARARRRLGGVGCLFLYTVRSEEADPEVRDAMATLRCSPETVWLELGQLSREAMLEFLGLATRIEDLEARDALERLLRAAGGSPLYVVELLRTLAETGALEPDASGQLVATRPLPDPLPFPAGILELLERRIALLPDDAVTVAARLAALGGRAEVDLLRDESRLSTPRFSRALGTLLERDILQWTAPTRLSFGHEEIRRTVVRRFPLAADVVQARRERRRRRLWAAAAAALVFVLLVPLGARLLTSGGAGASPAPYGGGTLVLRTDRRLVELRPTSEDPGGWTVRRRTLPASRADEYSGPFRTTSGTVEWYGRVTGNGSPPWDVRVLPDGTVREVARSDWDENRAVLSPDGGRIAWSRGHVVDDHYAHEVRVARADGTEPRVVLSRDRPLTVEQWSPTGRHLLVVVNGGRDSLVVVTPNGEIRAAHEFGGYVRATWCGQTGLFVVEGLRGGRPGLYLGRAERPDMEVVTRGDSILPSTIACSPDGSAVVYLRAVDGRPTYVLQELRGGAIRRLPVESTREHEVAWLPDSLAPVPVRLSVRPDSVRIGWGDTLRLDARVSWSDGAGRAARVEWASTDPAIASVRPDGVVSGNGPGHAVVTATVDGWIRDSVSVEVLPTERPDVLLSDGFERLDPGRWLVYGRPPAVSYRRGETTALELTGDGVYHDGVLSREGFPLRAGATLELEFRMPLTVDHAQRFSVCLLDTGPDISAWSRDGFQPSVREATCFSYPAEEFAKFDPAELRVSAVGWFRTVRLEESFSTDDWVRVALQVRADGIPSFFVNGREVAEGSLRLTGLDRPTWHVMLQGKAVGTRLLVRRLVVWRGARFGSE